MVKKVIKVVVKILVGFCGIVGTNAIVNEFFDDDGSMGFFNKKD